MTYQQTYDYIFRTAGKIISNYLRLKDTELQANSHIVDDLGADSLAMVELGFQISEKFNVPIMDASEDKLVFNGLIKYIQENLSEEQLESIERKQ